MGIANAIHVPKDSGWPLNFSSRLPRRTRLGPVPMVVPVPPILAAKQTDIASIA